MKELYPEDIKDLYERDEKGRFKLSASERKQIIENRLQGLNDDGTEKDNDEE